jgi:ATP-dependent DNA helicase RecG
MNATESDHVENKQSLNEWREIVETVAAFATARGGTIRIGIGPAGGRVGVQLGSRSLENLADQIKTNTEPPQYPTIAVEGEESAAVVAVRVEESPIKPVWAFSRPFKRVGRTNQRLTADETRWLTEQTTGRTWDALACEGFRLEDIDRQAVEFFLRQSGQDPGAGTEHVLQNLKLLTSSGPCRAAALLFAQESQQFVPGAQVKCGRFLGVDSVQFLDEQTIYANVLTQVDRVIAFVTRNTRQGIRFTGRAEREIVPEYPVDAVREAVTNAVCHRDYTVPGTVQVRIYDDRLEVWNPGKLPPDLTIQSLYEPHASRPRNPRLAEALYRARLIEQWGTGTLRIIRECEAAGMARPEFAVTMGEFIVRFRRIEAIAVPARIGELSDREREAFAYVQQHGTITRRRFRELVGGSERQAARDLASLVERGIFAREGRGAATHYTLSTRDTP